MKFINYQHKKKMKNLRQFILALLLCCTSGMAWAYDFETDGIYYNITSDTVPYTVEVTYQACVLGGDGDYHYITSDVSSNLIIPESVIYNGINYSVTGIGHHAYSYSNNLTSVTIPNSIEKIQGLAFSHCTSLTTVNFYAPDCRVTSYNGWKTPFLYCDALANINIGDNVQVINNVFESCLGFSSVNIPNSVTKIGDHAFKSTNLSSITIPSSVTYIGWRALLCNNLMAINVDSENIHYKSIDGVLFNYESNKLIQYPAGRLGDYCIPESVETIGSEAFMFSKITSVSFPNSVKTIQSDSFYGCSGLTSVFMGDSLNFIGGGVFYDCIGLESITIPNSVTCIGYDAFVNTGWYDNQPDGILYLDNWCIGYKGDKPIGDLNLEESTRGIACSAFSGCSGLTSIEIPNSIIAINDNAFSECAGITSISLPESLKSIGGYAFSNCTGLCSVNFNALHCTSESLSYWYDYCPFYGCNALTTVNIGENVQILPISIFSYCESLSAITIPNSVISIEESAFYQCIGLTSITIPKQVTAIGSDAFSECTELNTVNFNATNCEDPNQYSDSTGIYYGLGGAFRGCPNLNNINIGDSVKTIRGYLFSGCTSVTSINIPYSVNWIGDGAFYGCTGLTTVTIGNSVETIGNDAFYGCNNLSLVRVLRETPPTLYGSTFSYSTDRELRVICGNKESYETSAWGYWFYTITEENCLPHIVELEDEATEGGIVSLSTDEATKGDEVLINITVEDGYAIKTITVYNPDDPTQTVPVYSKNASKSAYTYAFIMPNFEVKVAVDIQKSGMGVNEYNGTIAATLYPNPTNGIVTIGAENLQRVSVFNVMGQKVLENTASGNSFECDLSRYGAGIYMMQIETAKGLATRRVVVE